MRNMQNEVVNTLSYICEDLVNVEEIFFAIGMSICVQ